MGRNGTKIPARQCFEVFLLLVTHLEQVHPWVFLNQYLLAPNSGNSIRFFMLLSQFGHADEWDGAFHVFSWPMAAAIVVRLRSNSYLGIIWTIK